MTPEELLLAAVERARQHIGDRCRECTDRPERFPVHDPWVPPHTPPPTDEELAPCSACGWQPFYVAIHHTDSLSGRVYTEWEYFDEVVVPTLERLANGGTWQDEIERERARIQTVRDV